MKGNSCDSRQAHGWGYRTPLADPPSPAVVRSEGGICQAGKMLGG